MKKKEHGQKSQNIIRKFRYLVNRILVFNFIFLDLNNIINPKIRDRQNPKPFLLQF